MHWWVWVLFVGVILAFLGIDLVSVRHAHADHAFRRAAAWSLIWLAVGVGFAAVVWAWLGGEAAGEYVTGYLVERSLSLDNLFVFAVIFGSFAVPARQRERVLIWGVLGALALRGGMIAAGAALLDAFHAVVYVFGAILLVTAVRFAMHRPGSASGAGRGGIQRVVRRLVPTTDGFRGGRLVVREEGRLRATPLVAALVAILVADVVFAVDSVPAIFGITRDTFLVFATNAFALLGLRSLFVLLAGLLERFERLQLGLAVAIGFVGVKMLASDLVRVPTWVSLIVIVGSLVGAVLPSFVSGRGTSRRDAPDPRARPKAEPTAPRP